MNRPLSRRPRVPKKSRKVVSRISRASKKYVSRRPKKSRKVASRRPVSRRPRTPKKYVSRRRPVSRKKNEKIMYNNKKENNKEMDNNNKENKMSDKYRNEISWNGYQTDIMKSGLQKYIRRGNFEKALYCAGELDLFKYAPTRGEPIRTNFLHRLMITYMEDVENMSIFNDIDILITNLFSEREKPNRNKSIEEDWIGRIVYLLSMSEKARTCYHIRAVFSPKNNNRQLLDKYPSIKNLWNEINNNQINNNQSNTLESHCYFFNKYFTEKNILCVYYAFQIESSEEKLQVKYFRSSKPVWFIFNKLLSSSKNKERINRFIEWYKNHIGNMKEGFLCWLFPLLYEINVIHLGKHVDVPPHLDSSVFTWDKNRSMETIKIDDYVIDKHTKKGRGKGIGILDFAINGAFVENEASFVNDLWKKFFEDGYRYQENYDILGENSQEIPQDEKEEEKVSPKKKEEEEEKEEEKVSPKKVSPKKVSPKKVSPKKVSPKKVSPNKKQEEEKVSSRKLSSKKEKEEEINDKMTLKKLKEIAKEKGIKNFSKYTSKNKNELIELIKEKKDEIKSDNKLDKNNKSDNKSDNSDKSDNESLYPLETDEYDFIVLTQLVTASFKPDVYFAKDKKNNLVVVKGPYKDRKDIDILIKNTECKKKNNLPYISFIVRQLIPDRFPNGIALGGRNTINRNKPAYFIIFESTIKESEIKTRIHSSKLWPETEVVDWVKVSNNHFEYKSGNRTNNEMKDYVHGILFRYMRGISDMSDRNFLMVKNRVISIDEAVENHDINILMELKKNKAEFVYNWIKKHYDELNVDKWESCDKKDDKKLKDIQNKEICINLFKG